MKYVLPTQVGVCVAASLLLAGTASAQNAPAAAKPSTWESSAALGLTLTRGNSDTLTFAAGVLGTRKWDQNEVNLGADATYGENNSIKNNETLRGFGQYNRLFSDRVFGYGRLEISHDAIADIEYRITASPGAGYYFIKNEKTNLRGEAGPGFIYEKQGNDSTGYFTLRLAERFEHKISDTAKVWQSLEFLPQVDKFENYLINAEVGIEAALTKALSLRTVLQDTYDHQPAPGRQKNDLKLITALAYKF